MVRQKGKILLLLLVLLILLPSGQGKAAEGATVYVIPVKGEIGPATTQFIRSSIAKAEADPNSVAILFEIDTLGGRVDQATQIRDIIFTTPLQTIAFVNNKAESAGVLITISAENIVMAPGATIGSAETIPYNEKNISYWRGELRTTAERRGRDARLVESMADRRIAISDPNDPEKFIVQEGELLNLTTKEAETLGFTDFTSNNYEDILSFFQIDYEEIISVQQDYKVRVAQAVTSSVVLPVILSIGFIGFVIEVLTPGFGFGGTISLIAFVIFFGGSVLAGNAGLAIIALFVTGIVLLLIEAMIPGFGAPGIGGVICITLSIILASDSIALGLTSLFIAFVMTIIVSVLLLKYAPRNKYFDKIILGTELNKGAGFSSNMTREDLLGAEGIAVTMLRPSGTMEVNEIKYDVVTEGGFIEQGARIRVIKVEGRRIVVNKID
ncbi:NfeD family protein [Geosporobacter ferrireducens]|uniref:Nodulation efficiency protein D (NfeD) n=1 Tax=Geosporobacter ferrireducens TaxID=1424294 RepID=A0A1D8GC86_9FIRM|nr:NfeD family protein [Geosporobacter ferrireducens]AOT68525.1 Nodulation efficiency protein D (NfeD) [Geosporobacter ferrireducens]MTI53989.1 nodulation protein NfeD [Geosporobacter ferrireducens]